MDAFDKAEIANRPKAIEVLEKCLKNSGWVIKEPDPTLKTHYDFLLEKDGKKVLVEHKDRGYASTRPWKWQVDGNKVIALLKEVKECKDVIGAYYINTFTDGKWAIWDLTKRIGEWRESAPHYKKSVVRSELVTTYDLFLDINEAVRYE